ncbi:uncharacterized protein [Aegilops tauschii subsp. strangulata]|uniref:uncharacterized protein isoform X2 n=1 Tax=Aegilops tauschii subsp. strangulata TaxID=200361 RepID=UPI003CC8DC45
MTPAAGATSLHPRSTSPCPSASPMAHGTCRRTRPSAISCIVGATSLRTARRRVVRPMRLSYDASLQPRHLLWCTTPAAGPALPHLLWRARLSVGHARPPLLWHTTVAVYVWNNATGWPSLIGLCIFNDSSREPYDLSDDDTNLQKKFTRLRDHAAALRNYSGAGANGQSVSPKGGGPCNMKKTIQTKGRYTDSQGCKETCRSAFQSYLFQHQRLNEYKCYENFRIFVISPSYLNFVSCVLIQF